MKRLVLSLVVGILMGLVLLTGSAAADGVGHVSDGKVVVANRASGTISVIDAVTDELSGSYALPEPHPAEPMYVNYNSVNHYVFVGDRANDRVVVFDGDDFDVVATVPTGQGVFHMWSDIHGRQLWVVGDVDNTATVIDTRTLDVIAIVPMPADLVAAGGKPHDVIVDREGRRAYVTMLGFAGDHDYVVQYSTRTFAELNRAAVGKDPHLSLTQATPYLYVPAQNSDVVSVLDRRTLAPVTGIAVPGAHGAGMRLDGAVFYTTNLPGGGADGLVAIDPRDNTVLAASDTPYPVPHNIALTPDGQKLFVTHSGATADKVTIYSASRFGPAPVLQAEVTVGLNPFGLAYVP